MNKLDEQYRGLLAEVLHNGIEKEDRTGTGTLSRFGMSIRHDMSQGFPILTTKKIAWKTMVTELKWFLKGDTNIKYLVDNGCNIWNGDAYRRYCKLQVPHDHFETQEEFVELIKTNDKFAAKWGELGPIYGKQWRDINGIDQLEELIIGLINNPNGRRHIVDSWNSEQLHLMTLPPCHYSFQCYVADGKLSLMWNQRSADLFLGVPFNISSYGLLLHLLCKETKLEPGYLIGSFGDIHLYKNHIEQAKEQISRDGFDLPELKVSCYDIYRGDFDAELVNYKSHPAIKAPLSN
ncbi:thymidylate synthase [bacterium]|nr:thymidylate synthase [bacterium]